MNDPDPKFKLNEFVLIVRNNLPLQGLIALTESELVDLIRFRLTNCGCEAKAGSPCTLCQKIRTLLTERDISV